MCADLRYTYVNQPLVCMACNLSSASSSGSSSSSNTVVPRVYYLVLSWYLAVQLGARAALIVPRIPPGPSLMKIPQQRGARCAPTPRPRFSCLLWCGAVCITDPFHPLNLPPLSCVRAALFYTETHICTYVKRNLKNWIGTK